MNRVTIHWTGPSWLKRFDPKRKMKLFWRAKAIYIGNKQTTDQMLQSLTQLRYVKQISLGSLTKFSVETLRELRNEFELNIEDVATYPSF